MKVLRQLMRDSHMFDTTFVEGDPHLSAFYEGQRRLVTGILQRINVHTNNPMFYMESMNDQFPMGDSE